MTNATGPSHGSSASPQAEQEHAHPGLAVEVERTGASAKVRVHVAAEEIDRARARQISTLARRVSMKGFRPGKAPPAMIEKHFEGDIERGVIEHFADHAYKKAVADHKLRAAAFPRIELGEERPKRGQAFDFGFEVLLRPDVELGQIEGLEIEGKPVEVSEEEVDKALAEIRRSNSRPEPAGDQGLDEDGLTVASLAFFRPGVTEPCLERDGIRLSPKAAPPGLDGPTFRETLVGAKAGEERSMAIEYPAGFPVEEARGEKGTVRFRFQEVVKLVPPTDEMVFKAFDVTDTDGLREAVKKRILDAKQEAEDARIENELLERLIDAHPMTLAESLVNDQVEAHQHELREALKKQGLNEEEARARAETERERGRIQAEKSLKAVYLIEEIARTKELKVNEQDLSEELSSIAQRNGTPVADVARYYKEQGLLRQLGLELLERKVRRYLRATADIRQAQA